jgi:cytosine/adenosine deaminase-related metal-dependent hydrolase
MATRDDPFTQAYLAGMPDTLEGTQADQPRPKTLPREAIALGGQVITPDGVRKGWVRVEGGTIAAVTTRRPTSAVTIQTDGVIMPGMLDLHGHPEFNVFAPWEPPRTYVNRYSWRSSKPYQDLVRNPQNELISKLPRGTQLRYAEIRALVGGVTAIQGASLQTQKGSHESMVRNVDGLLFGEHRARAAIDLPTSPTSRGGPEFKKVLDAIENDEVDAHYLHLAEGQRDNERSQKEFDLLAQTLKGLTNATVIIHGTALTRAQLGEAADAGARLVWSPQSNLRLYGETTRAADALDVGLPMALGADWLPSGSMSLLAEMKVARQELVEQGHPISAQELVTMVTSGAARVAGLAGKLGSLEVGRVADLVVMARQDDDVHESVCDSTPADVELVMIGGDVAYGRADWVRQLAADAGDPNLEQVVAWGRRMLLDTSFEVNPTGDPTPRLAQLRSSLTSVYPPVGPIWA